MVVQKIAIVFLLIPVRVNETRRADTRMTYHGDNPLRLATEIDAALAKYGVGSDHRMCKAIPERAQAASPDIPNRCDSGGEVDLHLPGEEIGERRPATAIGHVDHIDPGHHLEQLAGHMGHGADARRRHVDFAGSGLGVGDELGNRAGRNRRVHHHNVGTSEDARDRRDVADEIEVELIVERRVGRVGAPDHEQRVAVLQARARPPRCRCAATRPIVDDELLAELFRQSLTYQARRDVGRAGRRDWHADAPAASIGLRPCDAR